MFQKWRNYFHWTTKTPEKRNRSFELEDKKFISSKELTHQLNSLPQNNASDTFESFSKSGNHQQELLKIKHTLLRSMQLLKEKIPQSTKKLNEIQNLLDEYYLSDEDPLRIEQLEKQFLELKSKLEKLHLELSEMENLQKKLDELIV